MIIGGTKEDAQVRQYAERLHLILGSLDPAGDLCHWCPWVRFEQAQLILDDLSEDAEAMFKHVDHFDVKAPITRQTVKYWMALMTQASMLIAGNPAPKPEPELKLTTRGKVVGGIAIATGIALVGVALNILAGPARAGASTYPNGETQWQAAHQSTTHSKSSPSIPASMSISASSLPSTPELLPARCTPSLSGARSTLPTGLPPATSRSTPTLAAEVPLSPGVRATTGTSNPRYTLGGQI